MIVIGLMIFSFCTWAIFSKRFCEGIVSKHFLVFSAITAMLVIVDPKNMDALISSGCLLISGIVFWYFKHKKLVLARRRHQSN